MSKEKSIKKRDSIARTLASINKAKGETRFDNFIWLADEGKMPLAETESKVSKRELLTLAAKEIKGPKQITD